MDTTEKQMWTPDFCGNWTTPNDQVFQTLEMITLVNRDIVRMNATIVSMLNPAYQKPRPISKADYEKAMKL